MDERNVWHVLDDRDDVLMLLYTEIWAGVLDDNIIEREREMPTEVSMKKNLSPPTWGYWPLSRVGSIVSKM